MISTGVFSPLTGFMGREDYETVVESMRLADGLVWSLPITISASDEEANGFDEGDEVALTNPEGNVVATIRVTDLYSYDKGREASAVYRTVDENHPGVAALYRQGNTLVGGNVTLLDEAPNPRPFPQYYYEPRELRSIFAEKGWRRVVCFQTPHPLPRPPAYNPKKATRT